MNGMCRGTSGSEADSNNTSDFRECSCKDSRGEDFFTTVPSAAARVV